MRRGSSAARRAAGAAATLACAAALLSSCARAPLIGCAYPGDRPMWERLTSPAAALPLPLPSGSVAAVAPHHLIDGLQLGAFWAGAAALEPELVVLVGPDHDARGPGVCLPRAAAWQTAFGELVPDRRLAAALLRELGGAAGPAGYGDGAFPGEHSIHAHAPYIKRLLPRARLLPLIVHGLGPAEAGRLGKALDRLSPARTLVVASVDFSHFQVSPWAAFHDEVSSAALESMDIGALYDIEADSPDSLACAVAFASARGAGAAARLGRSDSQERIAAFSPDVTSHLYYAFAPGPSRARASLSVMAVGDGAAFPGGDVLSSWRWSGAGAPSSALCVVSGRRVEFPAAGGPLGALRSREDRFLAGADLILLDLPPGTRVETRIGRAGGFVAAVAACEVRPAAEMAEIARKLKGKAAFLALAIDWEGMRPDPEALEEAMRGGADLVVGRRGGGPGTPIVRGGALAFPSLGRFGGGPGLILGATLYGDRASWRTLPLDPAAPEPRLDLDALAEDLGLATVTCSATAPNARE